MERIELGSIQRTFGLNGELRVYSETDFAPLRFKVGAKMFLVSKKGEEFPVTVKSFRDAGQFYFVGFEEIPTIEEAEKHLHETIQIEKKDATLPDGYYRNGELEGCSIFDTEGNLLGTVKRVETNAPTANLRVAREGKKDFFVPFLFDKFIVSVDLEKRAIVIKLMEGMLQ